MLLSLVKTFLQFQFFVSQLRKKSAFFPTTISLYFFGLCPTGCIKSGNMIFKKPNSSQELSCMIMLITITSSLSKDIQLYIFVGIEISNLRNDA